jgi:hypothetical protein
VVSGRNSRENRRRALDEARQAQQRRKRRRRLAAWGGAVVVVAGAGLGAGLGLSGSVAGEVRWPARAPRRWRRCRRTYALGEFFDEWGQPLGPGQVGRARGKVTVIVNGQAFKGDPRDGPLGSHENLQVEVGTPLIAPETINWPGTGL